MSERERACREFAPETPAVGVYCRDFLTSRMTFVHSHLGSLRRYRGIGLGRRRLNADLLPWEPVIVPPPPSSVARLIGRIGRRIRGGFPQAGRAERAVFSRALIDSRARLVHAHFGPGGIDMAPVCRALRVPLVVTFHGFDASLLLGVGGYRKALRGLFDACAAVLCVSSPMRDRLRAAGCPNGLARVFHLGIDTSRFTVADRTGRTGPTTILQVCGLVEKKGVFDTLRAFRRSLDRGVGARLVLAGDGPLHEAVTGLAAELSLGESFRYEGEADPSAVARLMAEADIFVHPSVVSEDGDREGIPTVLMEAMATGLPVVSTLHEGIPELVEHGACGLLTDEGDVEAIAGALTRLAADPELRLRLGATGARRVRDEFDLAVRTCLLEDLYEEITAANYRRIR